MSIRDDAEYMARAIHLARRGRYTTDPNPRVGCVIVKDGKVIGEGWHVKAGAEHAEIAAIADAGDEVRDATAYVTLEPCSHHGKTPPCSDALIKTGIKRVVAAMQDPNLLVAGNGLNKLRSTGVEVDAGVLEDDAKALNPGFISRMERGRPFVISKLATSLDGRTAMASGESKWITSNEARLDVHRVRAESSAVLTGIETVLADDPSLNVRLNDNFDIMQPIRIILDSKLRMPLSAGMLKLPGRTLILTISDDVNKKQALEQVGAEVYRIAEDRDGRIDLNEMLTFLGSQSINQVLVEAGPVLNGALLTQQMVDELLIYIAPVVMGDEGRGLFNIPGLSVMADKIDLKLKETRQIGPDLRLKFVTN